MHYVRIPYHINKEVSKDFENKIERLLESYYGI